MATTAAAMVIALLTASGSVAAAPTDVRVSDPEGDVIVEGSMSEEVRSATDLTYLYVYRGSSSGRVVFETHLDGNLPSTAEGRTTFLISLKVTRSKRKPYRMRLAYDPYEVDAPLALTSDRSGRFRPFGCADTSVSVDNNTSSDVYVVYVGLAPRCFGNGAQGANGSVVARSSDGAGGGNARDGLQVPAFSVR